MKEFFFCIFFTLLLPLYAVESGGVYPRIRLLYSNDLQFAQLSYDLKEYYRNSAAERELPPLAFRLFTPAAGDTLMTTAGSFSLPYESLATLNRLASNVVFDGRQTVLIPNLPFLFVSETPKSELETLLSTGHEWDTEKRICVARNGKKEFFFYTEEAKFTDMERSYFLGILRYFPVPRGKITSLFGKRNDPFHGRESYHGGIDIAAPEGTGVVAPQSGRVILCASGDPVYGTYVEIDHGNGVRTRYGHLSAVYVQAGEQIAGGQIIAAVGETGRATGPHLHFEYFSGQTRRNPKNFLNF